MTPLPKKGPDDAHPIDEFAPTETMPNVLLKGRYALGPELGRGGFAITYLAADTEMASRKVVVKILNERHSGDSWSLKKFHGEMEALARIDHPNVVGVLDYWVSENGQQFLVMQYVPGGNLRGLIQREGLAFPAISEAVVQIGRALTAAHEAGVIHRDIKPENVMIWRTEDGGNQIKLIDFGVAAIRNADIQPSSAKVCGTFSYMAPEQFEGRCSPASDIYQMGILDYEMVTGNVPFRAASREGIALQQREGLKVLPRYLRPDLPESAEKAILKALSPNPSDRFQSARDFGEALGKALESAELMPASWVRRTWAARWRTASRRPSVVRSILVAAAIVSALAMAVYFVFPSKSPPSDSVAVLPFENRTGDAELDYLGDGITESLIADLSSIPTLRVSARGSVLKYEGKKFDARTAGRDLWVARVLGGRSPKGTEVFS
jgi:serine/threonine-protein kinase